MLTFNSILEILSTAIVELKNIDEYSHEDKFVIVYMQKFKNK